MKFLRKSIFIFYLCLIIYFLFLITSYTYAQQVENKILLEKKPIKVSIVQINPIQFGSFCDYGSGGTVNISNSSIRTSTGSIVLLYDNEPVSSGIFEAKAPSNTMIQINYDTECMLKGPKWSKLKLVTGDLSTGKVFVTPSNAENGFLISLGGYIEVKNNNSCLPGEYSGQFHITIIVE